MTSGERAGAAAWNLTPADVRLQEARILQSDSMSRAGRIQQQLLLFFVEEWIKFGERPISQKRLAEEVLGKDPAFSPARRAHVRVYLQRLRKRLSAYYARPGGSDPLVIGIASNPYRLVVTPPPPAGADAVERRGSRAATRGRRGGAKQASLVMLTDLSAPGLDGDLKPLAALVPHALMQHLLGKHGLVAIGPVRRDQLSDRLCESPMVRMSAADYLLDGILTLADDATGGRRPLEVVVRLHDVGTGNHVWSYSCSGEVDCGDLATAAERVAARVAAALLSPAG